MGWGDDAAWQCISSSISYFQSGDNARPPFGPLHSPSALTFPCSPPPRTPIPFEQPQMSVLSSDSEVYVFAIRIQKVLDRAIFASHGGVVQASPDEGCDSGWEIMGLGDVDESEARATRTRGSTIGENMHLSRLDGVARQLWSVLLSVELLELVAQRYNRFYGVPLISDKPFRYCFAVLLNVRTRYDGSVACSSERPSCCCRRHP